MLTKLQHKGFTLIEILVSLIVASIALLGLAAGQLKSLQYATNSFDYTMSVIQANNAIERVWPYLCQLQHSNPSLYDDAAFRANLAPQTDKYTLVLPDDFSNDLTIQVSWEDKRLDDNLDNEIAITGSYPALPSTCTP
ncbi:prepilin-type N-terminal cleavage/methylation domain-containing protein [Pseudoalteromonas sp. MMG010]|uniref:prepilin-type N-terminal cleavage/methylation domain-containing protein n=1 Tax=Pseudoalteromonas sp. MMG010 TaxID=2822685 RepID=UPI001FFD4BB8|nr:prepilin-type N-terminal cleavage/methylation domain-containing protein [Pseudoalteromonas sp. MMG010]